MICGMVSSCIFWENWKSRQLLKLTQVSLRDVRTGLGAWVCTFKSFQEKRKVGVCPEICLPGDWEPSPLTEFNIMCMDQDGSQLNHDRKKTGTPSLTQLHSGGLDSLYTICLMSAEIQSPHWDFIYIDTWWLPCPWSIDGFHCLLASRRCEPEQYRRVQVSCTGQTTVQM